MNAVIALNHFCESHGPNVIFTTTTLRETNLDEISFKNVAFDRHNCPSCNSIGLETGYSSVDHETNTKFFSSQHPVLPDTVNVLKIAATRSLSCETSYNKNGGFVFFGDSSGHVLSHTFHVADSNARGLFKLFSITILMKDKTFLLNTEPFLSQNLGSISKELQEYATKVYDKEQSECSQRAQRLNAGKITSNTKRSLVDLTGEECIFGFLHSHFAWLLWAGARYLSESITLGSPTMPPWIGNETVEGFTMVQLDKNDLLLNRMDSLDICGASDVPEISLRQIKLDLGQEFLPVCFCVVAGIQVILRGDEDVTAVYARCLQTLLPVSMYRLVKSNAETYEEPYRILGLSLNEAVPNPNTKNVLHIDFIDGQLLVKYNASILPSRMPNFITKVNKAVDEKAFTETVLEKRIKVLVEEWKNKVQCLQKIRSNQDTSKLKKVLGVQLHDQPLITSWISHL